MRPDDEIMSEIVDEENEDNRPFEPDWVVPPGALIQERMEFFNVSKSQLAEFLDMSLAQFENLLVGAEPVTHGMAILLTGMLGGNVSFWMALENNYQKGKKRLGL